MYKKNKIVAIIPARSGSKGIKNKNIILLHGKHLIGYTIEAALQSKYFDDVIVSTDSNEIANIAELYGASIPFLRPQNIANDTAKGEDVILHALTQLKSMGKNYDIVVYLQPTSPLRTCNDICETLDFFIENKLDSLTTLSPVQEHPLFMRTLDASNKVSKVLCQQSNVRRQDLDPYYILNGAIYINRIPTIKDGFSANDNEYGFILSERSSLDINTNEDLDKAMRLLSASEKV